MEENKRLFFGTEISAAWPDILPSGRVLKEEMRHITLSFLGHVSLIKLSELLGKCPKPDFEIGICGKCNRFVFLPNEKYPRVVAGEPAWLQDDRLSLYQHELHLWLKLQGYPVDEKKFFPHITIAREPFEMEEWRKVTCPFPFFIKAVHLYESVGNLTYHPRWSHLLLSPFEEIEHTADIAYIIRGESFEQLFLHGALALAFKHPSLLNELTRRPKLDSLDEVIIALNEIIALLDAKGGSPFKAVSFHGEAAKGKILEWKMIVDV